MAEEFEFDPDEVTLVSKGDQPGEPGAQPGEPGGKGKLPKNMPTPDDVHEKIQQKMGQKEDTASGKPGDEGGPGMGPGAAGSPGSGGPLAMGAAKKRVGEVTPKMNWKALVRKMVASSQLATDLSYSKPSRRSVTGAAIGAALGAAAIKPGEKTVEEPVNKVLFVFDTSGSMWGYVPAALAEAQSLLKQVGKVNYPFGVMFFAGEHQSFVVNQGQNYYSPVESLRDISKPVPKNNQIRPWGDVLTQHGTGGTLFSPSMANELKQSIAQGYNIILFSDDDMVHPQNWPNFVDLWKSHKRNVFFVTTTQAVWREVCQKLGQYPDNFTSIQQ